MYMPTNGRRHNGKGDPFHLGWRFQKHYQLGHAVTLLTRSAKFVLHTRRSLRIEQSIQTQAGNEGEVGANGSTAETYALSNA